MSKQNANDGELIDDGVTINLKESSISEFTQRNLPSDEDVEKFESLVSDSDDDNENAPRKKNEVNFSAHHDVSDQEIQDSLNEIYQDEDGHMVDVKRIKGVKKRGFFFWLFFVVFVFGGIGSGGYFMYNKYLAMQGTDSTAINFTLEGKSEVIAGEEFFYTINYTNSSSVGIRNVRIEATYPANFVFLDSFPEPSEKDSVWNVDAAAVGYSGKIKIRGMIIGKEEDSGVMYANMRYMPENFSSEFKKSASITSRVKDSGVDLEFDYVKSTLVDEENEVLVRFKAKENNFINNFRISQTIKENVDFIDNKKTNVKEEERAKYSVIRPGVWQIDEVLNEVKILPIKFKFNKKNEREEKITLTFEKLVGDSRYVVFFVKELDFELMKSDLNLTMIVNGSNADQGINFSDTLNYSIVYSNKGETEMTDVIIMAVLDSDFLDWNSLSDKNKGIIKANTITWSKNEIPELESLSKNQEGVIDFSINVVGFGEVSVEKPGYEVKSYAQFSVGKSDTGATVSDSKSNEIINKINSDLKLVEEIRYFDVNNIPVGTGPNPPKVNEETTYKVYWNLKNSLHELKDLKVSIVLPSYVTYADKASFSAGSLEYSEETREVVWNIGRLPVTVLETNAEFSIAVKPNDDNKNKIMVLLSGTKVSAIDSETGSSLSHATKAKTTKLEDDEIGAGDGIVQ